MPLEPYLRAGKWWAKGRVEFNGRPISGYIRQSTGATEIDGARDWIRERTESELRKHHFGDEQLPLTVNDAVLLADLDAQSARYLIKIVEEIGNVRIDELTKPRIKKLCETILPDCSTDTWRRWVVVPLQMLANAGAAVGRCSPLRLKGFTAAERLAQDQKRGKPSRVRKTPGSKQWLEAFRRAAPHEIYVMARFMFETAARIGQTTAMGPRHLAKIDQCIVLIPAAKGHSEKELQISQELVDLLKSVRPKAPRGWAKNKENLRVFGYASKDGPRKAWDRACAKAGIERLTPHGAGRHGFATEMYVRKGVDLKSCTEYGRWSDHALFLETYAHAENAAEKILAAINPESAPAQRRPSRRSKRELRGAAKASDNNAARTSQPKASRPLRSTATGSTGKRSKDGKDENLCDVGAGASNCESP